MTTVLKGKAFDTAYGLYNRDAISSSEYQVIRDGLEEIETLRDRDMALEEMWRQFADVPMNLETECIEEEFFGWGPGVSREEIWHWFDQRHSKGIAYLLYGTTPEPGATMLMYYKSLCDSCGTSDCVYNCAGECRYPMVFHRVPIITDENGCRHYARKEVDD